MKYMEASKDTDVSKLDYMIVRSTVSNQLFCVIAVDKNLRPLFADTTDVSLEVAVDRMELLNTLRSTRDSDPTLST